MSFALWDKKLEGTLDLEDALMWPTVPLRILGKKGMDAFLKGVLELKSVFLFSDTPQGVMYWRLNGPRRRVIDLTKDELNWLKACLIKYHGYTEEKIHELRFMEQKA